MADLVVAREDLQRRRLVPVQRQAPGDHFSPLHPSQSFHDTVTAQDRTVASDYDVLILPVVLYAPHDVVDLIVRMLAVVVRVLAKLGDQYALDFEVSRLLWH